VEANGRLTRACATVAVDGMSISTKSAKAAAAAQVEAFDRILSNHMLYCTVCDNNNGVDRLSAFKGNLRNAQRLPEQVC
jgi:formate dehydrogenase major subunit